MEKKKIFTLLVLLITMLGGAKAETYTTVYDIASTLVTGDATYQSTTATLAPTTKVDAANAPNLVVNALNGKLGKNNDSWAQIGQNTVLILPGVPSGATITFSLYNTTALTINGTDYTNGQTYTTTASGNVVMTCPTASNGYIKSITVVSEAFTTNYTTIYDIASTLTQTYNGSSGTLAASTKDDAANAPELTIDATNGKLGVNNTSWSQINSGTMLTLAGVPGGATIFFSLYQTTPLQINGVTYTNGGTYTTTSAGDVSMTCTANGYIKSITVVGTPFVKPAEPAGYSNTWYFGISNGAETFALQKSAEYTYTVNEKSLVINTASGKLSNSGRNDKWAQCNDGTLFKVPVYEGAKLSWGKYNDGSSTGFTIDGKLLADNYVATADGTVEMTAKGIGYLSFITIAPVSVYEISGTIAGGAINGASLLLTSATNGQIYSATITDGAFSLKVPADSYTPSLGGDVAYVISSPASVVVSGAGSVGTVNITAAAPQTVTGNIVNAPAEAFTLTFTGTNSANNKDVVMEANATSYSTTLAPDTYTISSSVGTLSTLSKESFTVLSSAVAHNIYYPEAAVPAATQQNITVDNTAAVAANVYRTITDALAAAKAGSISSPVITLTSGQTYQEQVVIDQANVTLKTSGEGKATITWYYGIGYTYYSLAANGYYDKDRANTRNGKLSVDPVRWGATVLVKSTGAGFKAENIIFENSFNQRYTAEEVADGVTPNGLESISVDRVAQSVAADSKAATERAAAIAFENNPTGCELYNCEFIGSQDTFYSSGNVHVKSCSITGNTDFIFGGTGGTTLFDNCDLVIGGYSDSQNTAYITASQAGQFIFRDCTVKGSGRTYVKANLGRDWGGTNANVYFFNLKNEIGDKLSYSWTDMGGAVSAGTANLHIYDFDATVNANYSTTGASGANVNGVLTDEQATTLYTGANSSADSGSSVVYATDLTFDETGTYNALKIAANNGTEVNVTLKGRTIHGDAGHWNTICLPYAMTASQIAGSVLSGAVIKELSGATIDGSSVVISFSTVTAMEAGKPYIICWETDQADAIDPLFEGVSIAGATPGSTTAGVATFHGTYMPFTMTANDKKQLYLKDKQLWYPTAAITVKPFRGYFTLTQDVPASVNKFVLDTDGEGVLTGIESVRTTQPADAVYYNLNGQRVDKPAKGLYIVNGKKVVVK